MRLIIMRHAQALPHGYAGDHSRSLTPIGIEQATAAGVFLTDSNFMPTQAIVSSSARTQETFKLLGIDVPCEVSDKAYNASVSSLTQIIRETPATECLLVIAHNPGVTELVNNCGYESVMSPATVVVIDCEGNPDDFDPALAKIVADFRP